MIFVPWTVICTWTGPNWVWIVEPAIFRVALDVFAGALAGGPEGAVAAEVAVGAPEPVDALAVLLFCFAVLALLAALPATLLAVLLVAAVTGALAWALADRLAGEAASGVKAFVAAGT